MQVPSIFQLGFIDHIAVVKTEAATSTSWSKEVPDDEVWLLLYGDVYVKGTTPTLLNVYCQVPIHQDVLYKADPTSEEHHVFPTTVSEQRNLNASLILLRGGDVIYVAGTITSGSITLAGTITVWRFKKEGRF